MIAYENLYLLNKPFMEEFKSSFSDSLDQGWYILGNKVLQFENDFAAYCGSEFCAGVASGLDALILALRYFEFAPGSEVIVPANTYIATLLAIYQNGLIPILIEPDLETYNIDPLKIREKITPKTKAILLVHLYGKACDMDPILKIASAHGLEIIEDCAQSHGATYKGKMTGTFGAFGAFSFYPTKNLGALGDAGALLCSDLDMSRKIKALRNYGCEEKYQNKYIGINSRLDEIQAGFLNIKLKYLDTINEHKRKLAGLYQAGLKSEFIKPVVHMDYLDAHHIFNIRHDERDRLRTHLLKNDINTEIHYPIAPHQQKAIKDKIEGDYPITELIHKTTLSLPISYHHSEKDIEKVIRVMNEF
jgi:dTDP-4-amino-4,6-dideoxygalactose transaminase